MSIRSSLKSISSKIPDRLTVAPLDSAFRGYDSSENLIFSIITDSCARSNATCYSGPQFWQYTNIVGPAVDIVTGYINVAAAATAAVLMIVQVPSIAQLLLVLIRLILCVL